MNPVAPLVSLLAIAAGVFGGFALGAWATPELPDDAIDPGVAVEDVRKGSDPESLYHPEQLSAALDQTLEQFPAGETVSNVLIEPDDLRANPAEGPNVLPLEELPVEAPETMIAGINEVREQNGSKPITLDDVKYFSWSPANPTNIEWSVLLDIVTAGPPTQFAAGRDGGKVKLGP